MTKIYKKPRLGRSLLNLLITGLCLMAFNYANAQVSTLDYSTSVQSYSSLAITGGTLVSGTSSIDDDTNWPTRNIGFTFNHAGTNYTTIGISSNGYIVFGGATTTNYTPLGGMSNCVAALGSDLQGRGLTNSDIRWDTVGTAPNRTCIIQWRDWGKYAYTSELYNFQIRLTETTNAIQIVYGPGTYVNSFGMQVGMTGATTGDYKIRTGNTSSWAVNAAATANTATMTLSSTNFPDTGRTFTFANLPMVFNGVTTFQTTGNASSGLNNNPILAAVATTTGNLNPKVVYAMDFNTAGSNNIGTNVTAARVLYTGNTSTFSMGAVIRQFGADITTPSGTLAFTSAGDTLRSGANYYWLVYDIPTTSNLGDTLDGTCTSFTDSITRTPTVVSPAGYRIISGPLSGVYTIGGSGSRNYPTIAAAVSDLINVGVAGPVTFNVAAGTYTGQVVIPNNVITGASAINNITFDGGNGNASTRILTSSTASGATLLLNGCKYYTFKNLTITNTVSGGGSGVAIVGTNTNNNGSSNVISNCRILLPNVGTSTAYGIVVTASANGNGTTAMRCDSIVLDSNTITGGTTTNGIYYGIAIYGSQNSLYNRGIEVTNNTLTMGYYMGFQIQYIYNPFKINYNNVTMSTSYGYYGMYLYYNQSTNTTVPNEFIGNTVTNFGGYGAYMYFNGSGGTTNAPLRIYNNFINNGTTTYGGYYGIYLYSTGVTQVYHNTTRMTYSGTSTTYTGFYNTGGTNCTVKNNLFSVMPGAGSTVPAYFATNPTGNVVNYNLYYNGANATLLYRGSALTSSNFKTTTGGGDSSFFTTTSPYVSTTNFNLQNGCFGKGVDLTSLVPADITRFTRNVPPDLGAFEFQGGGLNDLSMDRLITPAAPITLGSQDLVFRVKNIGTNAISSFDANYTLNSGTPVNQTWSGTLASCDTVSITFTGGQQITLGSTNAIKVYTANPNSSVDPNRNNDTISVNLTGPLNGAYTINPSAAASSTNFQSFAAANAALSGGVGGPVTFTVSPGTYTQVTISGTISGASSTNTVVFDGVSASNRIISTSTSNQAALILNATTWVTFRNFTIQNTVSVGATGVGIVNGMGNTIRGCNILLPNVSTNTAYGIAVTSSANGYGTGATTADSITLDSNTITGGGTSGVYYGIMIYGNQNASANRGMVVTRNTVTLSYYMGFYMPYIYNAMVINYNNITMNSTYGYYGMYNFYQQNLSTTVSTTYIGNVVKNFGGYGIYMYFNGSGGTTTAPLRVYNNIIDNGTNTYAGYYGIYLYNTGFSEVYHNVTRMTYGGTSTTYTGFYYTGSANGLVKNNYFICASSAGSTVPAYFGTSPSTSFVNYNAYFNAANSTVLYRGTALTTLNFKTTTGGGDSSYYITTLPFVNVLTGNYNITNGCGNKGVTLTNVPTDITGYTRNTPPDLGPYEFQGGSSNDIGIDALLSPVFPVVAGSNDVTVRVRNTGANTVSSFDVAYTINGGTPVSTTWSGTLAACDTVSVTVSTPFTVVNNVQYALKVYTSNPNSSLDPSRNNDTISSIVATPMSGTYTIGATASDYTTFNNAVAAMQLRGVAGPITFNVRTGVYTESVNLPTITGMSATNTVTFTSAANNKDSVRLAWSSATGNAYVLKFTGNFFKVNAMTIQSTSTGTNNDGVNVGTTASFDTLSNCNVRMPIYNTSFVFTQYSINANTVSGIGMAFINNVITGSYYGVYYYGSSANRPKYTYWKGNTFDSAYYSPFYYNYYGKYTTFDGNTFRSRPSLTTNTNYMYWYYQDSAYTFVNNIVDLNINSNGLTYWYNYYRANTTVLRGLVANNSIASTNLNMYWGNTTTSNIDFFNNSFNTGTGYFYLANTGLTNVRIRNNIFAGTGAYAYYITAAPNIATLSSDYNNYFSTSSTTPIYSTAARNLNTHRAAYPLFDKNSVSYRPAYTSANNLTPNVNDTAVWVMNGRGEYLGNVTTDINGAARPANLAAGAPDLGAYNVNPATSTMAPMAIANPASPTAGTTQVFTFGLDTVASITWDAFTTPPASIAVRQYAGRAPQTIGTVTNYMNFYTDIQAPAGTYLYDIKLNYRDNWMGTMYTTFGFTEADLRLAKKDAGSAWSTNTASTVDSTMNTLTGTGYTGFSWFTGSDIFNQLPVKLTTFNGKLVNADAILNWNTASEINSNSFVVERSIDGVNFEGLGKVKAAGNSSSLKSYKFADVNALALVNKFSVVYYRLKMVDNDGSFEYSKTIEVKTDADTKESVKVNPNPFINELTVSIETLVDSKATLEVVDINGKVTLTQNVNVTKGTSAINVDGIEKLKQGVYFVRVSTDLGTQVFKMVKN